MDTRESKFSTTSTSNMQRRDFLKSASAAAILISPAAESLFAATGKSEPKEQSGNPAGPGAVKKAEDMHLSPSEAHKYVMSRMKPELQYDGGDVRQWQKKLREKLRQLLGAMPKSRCDLRPRRIWKRDHPLGTIEKIVFTSEPCSDVPAYVCLPKNAAGPYTFMICVQGHNSGMHNSIAVQRKDETQRLKVEGDRDFAIQCMSRGIAALCIEQRAFGERREVKQKKRFPQICHDTAVHALMLGRTLIGERVYDVDRGIDYLASRGDANMKQIGIMGNSGGGMTSIYSAATLSRIALAMPGCSFCPFPESAMSIRHCPCNYIPDMLTIADMPDILGLFAPRPLVIVSGKNDPIFPIDAVGRGYRHLQKIYDAFGAKTCCHHVVGDQGHRFYADLAWPVMMKAIDALRKSSHTLPHVTSPSGANRASRER
jgi:dienelactone hydrolase